MSKSKYILLFFLFSKIVLAQNSKIIIIDSEDLSIIKNARILVVNQVFYTNDDGVAIIPEKFEKIEVSAPNYQSRIIEKYQDKIKLKPLYKEIDEVKIIKVDVQEIFQNVLKNYDKVYYDKPSVYNILFKQKSYYDDKLAFIVIADGKLWSRSNQYNYKAGLKRKYDDILQIQLNRVKYLKTTKRDSLFVGKTNEFSHEIIGNYFFNFELARLLNEMKINKGKNFGTVIFQKGNNQFISFKTKKFGSMIFGNFIYNTLDKAITQFEVNYDQSDFPIIKKTSVDGKDFDYKMGIASLSFEFYLKDGKYIPSQYNFEGSNFQIIVDGVKVIKKFSKQITYNTFNPTNNDGLNPKIDFTKEFWENIPNNGEQITNLTILSSEEEQFLNTLKNEN